jgi:hypothetical protein
VGRRLITALAGIGMLSVVAIADRWAEAAHAQGAPPECVTIPEGAGGRAFCTYQAREQSAALDDLVTSVGGGGSSGIWIQAWGGSGGDGAGGSRFGGAGAPGGYAQTYYHGVSSYQATYGSETLFFHIGGEGRVASDGVIEDGGGGGASTLLASADVGLSSNGPCIVADPEAVDEEGQLIAPTRSADQWPRSPADNLDGHGCTRQNVVALAGGGGGGGGHASQSPNGKAGGPGGNAVATTTTTVAARGGAGDSGYPNRVGAGGFAGVGGKNGKYPSGNAADGIGGIGGPYGASDVALESRGTYSGSFPFLGYDSYGIGGRGYDFQDGATSGGGGGGGFGGGGGGGGGSHHDQTQGGGSGGGGGGSYAYGGDFAPGAVPPTGAPSADQGAARIVIDGVPEPKAPLEACAISQHGTEAAETLHGTSGGDDIFGHGGGDSIATGRSGDCVHAGGDDDTVTGGRGPDTIIAAGGHDVLRGGRGRDKISAEGGNHEIHGGRGADRIRSRDGKRDTVSCGAGNDVAWVDPSDRVARNCEKVHT